MQSTFWDYSVWAHPATSGPNTEPPYFHRAPDKLLDQLNIYSTWLFSIAYLRNQLCIFIPRFLWLQLFDLLNVAIWNSPVYIYSLTPFAFLEHQTSGFYHTSEANLVPYWYLLLGHTLLVSLSCFFPLNTWLVINILFIKLEFYCAHACKKSHYPTGIYILPKWKRKGPNGRQWYRSWKKLLFGQHTFNFNCLLDILIAHLHR